MITIATSSRNPEIDSGTARPEEPDPRLILNALLNFKALPPKSTASFGLRKNKLGAGKS